jgi:hypothetical protein
MAEVLAHLTDWQVSVAASTIGRVVAGSRSRSQLLVGLRPRWASAPTPAVLIGVELPGDTPLTQRGRTC